MPTRRQILASALASPAVFIPLKVAAAEPLVFQRNGLAISGYDPVAYFTEGGPVAGDAAFQTLHDDAIFQFASAENLAMFEADPLAFAPQYGGYCAFAVSRGYTAKTEPDAWSIFQDKLYLNFSKAVRARWALNKRANVAAADENWPSVLG